MNNKVLIFGLGFQGKKYINYFQNNGYIIDRVSKTGFNKDNIFGLNEILSFEYIKNKNDFNFKQYDYIIVAVNPYNEQDNVIKFLLEKEITNKIILEKPVSYDVKLLDKLIKLDNYYYFIDEIVLGNLYKKLFNSNRKNDNLNLILYDNAYDNYKHLLEHIIAPFLFFENFIYILDLIEIKFGKEKKENTLYYDIIYNNYIINFDMGAVSINSKKIYNLNFGKSVDLLLNLDDENNKLFKINFLIFRKKYEKNNGI